MLARSFWSHGQLSRRPRRMGRAGYTANRKPIWMSISGVLNQRGSAAVTPTAHRIGRSANRITNRSANPGRRRLITLILLIVGTLAFVSLDVRATPPPATSWSFALEFPRSLDSSGLGKEPLAVVGHLQADSDEAGGASETLADGAVYETEPIRAEVTVAGISWTDGRPAAAWVRASTDGADWTPWAQVVIEAEHGPDPGTAEAATQTAASEPVYVGEAQWIQYRVQPQRLSDLVGLSAEVVETAGRNRSTLQRLGDAFSNLTWNPADVRAAPGRPDIIGRDVWGGDRCIGEDADEPSYNDGARMLFVHHTATAGSYSEASAPGVVYAICSYHANNRGWRDIGYNFLIDVYGNIYEGRAGGVDRSVWGAHTGGFNYYSTGIALVADHDNVSVGPAALESLEALAAWKLDQHHIDPIETTTIRSLGSTRYEEGVVVDMSNVSGHRDASSTSCPGNLCYPLLGSLREAFAATGGVKILGPVVSPFELGPVEFDFVITEAADWSFSILTEEGREITSAAGSGTEVHVEWDGRDGGTLIAPGEYRVVLTATTDDGRSPTPVDELATWYRAPFRDDDTSIHEASINAIAAAGITNGCSDFWGWWYCPDRTVSRAQMASFLARALGLEPSDSDAFGDDDGSTHEQSIDALADAGITTGCTSGGFCPDRAITRGEMATFLARALDLQPASSDYFIDDNSHSHETAINAVAEAGLTLGCGGERFCPNDPVIRAQMASFLDRAFLSAP